MITLAEFLKFKHLIDDDQFQVVLSLEKSLTKHNFMVNAREVYRVIFNEEPDPVVFTGHKFFLTKVVKQPFTRIDLMEKGLHPFRMIFARYAERFRHPGNSQFDTNGIIVYEDFLDDSFHKLIKNEIERFPLFENIQSANNYDAMKKYNGLYSLINDTELFDYCVNAAHRNVDDVSAQDYFIKTSYVQRLENIPNNGDIQKVCHSDVFYPCVKYWYFPDAVNEDDGPFLFARNSVELTFPILEFHYRESVEVVKDTWDKRRNKGHAEGSFRALDDDLAKMGLKLEPITCKPNTLVIANTSGFHARGDAKHYHIRSALHGAIRVDTPYDTYA